MSAVKPRERHDDPTTGPLVPAEPSAKLRMRGDNALVLMDWIRDLRREEKTESGLLYLPKKRSPSDDEPVPALVIGVGPGQWVDRKDLVARGLAKVEPGVRAGERRVFIRAGFSEGDRVLVDHHFAGDPVMIDGLEHRIVKFHNVMGIVEGE